MTKDELKAKIENAAAGIENGEYVLDFVATALVYGGEIPFAKTKTEFDETDWENYYEDENGEKYTKAAAVVVKDEHGNVTVVIDDGECYPPVYTIKEFVEKYGV